MQKLDRIHAEIDGLTSELKGRAVAKTSVRQTTDRLLNENQVLGDEIPAIPARNHELQAIRDRIARRDPTRCRC